MVLYEFFYDDGLLGLAVFAILMLVLFCVSVCQIIKIVKCCLNFTLQQNMGEVLGRAFLLVIAIIAGVSFANFTLKFAKAYYLYSTQQCLVVNGTLDQVSSIRNDYRGTELYDISFNVNNIEFDKTTINCEKELLSELIDAEGRMVSVSYSKIEEGYFVYKIEIIQ